MKINRAGCGARVVIKTCDNLYGIENNAKHDADNAKGR